MKPGKHPNRDRHLHVIETATQQSMEKQHNKHEIYKVMDYTNMNKLVVSFCLQNMVDCSIGHWTHPTLNLGLGFVWHKGGKKLKLCAKLKFSMSNNWLFIFPGFNHESQPCNKVKQPAL